MKCSLPKFSKPALFFAGLSVIAAPAGAPSFENESLRYNINWPSGLSLGEAQLRAARLKPSPEAADHRHFEFDVDAGIPGFSVLDRYRSDASPEFCSAEFERKATHGKKKTDEKTTFDQSAEKATRETAGGGKSELQTPQCGKDALSFLYFVRRELSQGRIPPAQTVFFGAPYEVRLEFAGTQTIKVSDTSVQADRVLVSVKGAASDVNFEVLFLKDASRTPALVRVPLALGKFSMELVR